MIGTVKELFDSLWLKYFQGHEHVRKVYELFLEKESEVVNDHIALRTFDDEAVSIEKVSSKFKSLGYHAKGMYVFKEKKLKACHFEHENEKYPLVFISAFDVKSLSISNRELVNNVLLKLRNRRLENEDLLMGGRLWEPISYKDYQNLRSESEYAAWLCAFGYIPNHFTVSLNHCEQLRDFDILIPYLKENNIVLNDSGGIVKGTKEDKLIQASTKADVVEVEFSDGKYKIPGCYYEFAKRYLLPNGKLFRGFITTSADKIFESTDHKN